MFLFSCCQTQESEYAYQLRQNYQRINRMSGTGEIQDKINSSKQYIIKMKRSNYEDVVKSYKSQKWVDTQFLPSKQSLGEIPSVTVCNWRRVSQITTRPTLFSSKQKAYPMHKSVHMGQYFVSAISAIIQQPNKIKDIFGTQQLSEQGIYCVKMRINGQIQQVLVDDYVPINELGQALFTPPTQSQVWISILQKAWAKVNGSYENILNGHPGQIFKAFNFAPTQVFFIQDQQEKKEKIWTLLNDAVHRKSPVSFMTSDGQLEGWIHSILIKNHYYTLLFVGEVVHVDKKTYRVVKLRDPMGPANWSGRDSMHDKQFWNKVLASDEKMKLISRLDQKQGQMLILYNDFIKYFSQVHISYQLQQGNFIWEQIFFNRKNGSLWQIEISHQGQYSFELHQESLRNKPLQQKLMKNNRSTIILTKVTLPGNYEYVCGTMKFQQQDTLINVHLRPGKYVIYVKVQIDAKKQPHTISRVSEAQLHRLQSQTLTTEASLSCYSNKICKLRLIEKTNCKDFLQTLFLNYARKNKRQQYSRERMWLSWKLLFKQCGFAYIAFGNAYDSDKKFTIKFDSKQFESMHFKLKHPFKKDKFISSTSYQMSVMPGQQKIILARVINNGAITLKFPPPIQMKIDDLDK